MEINVIHNEKDYQLALRTIAPYFDAENEVEPGTPEGDRFTILAMMIEAYEKQQYVSTLPDPVAAIRFRMEQGNMKVADLVPFIGAPNRVYEVLNKKRALSIDMIRGLLTLGIPAEVLLQPYAVQGRVTGRGMQKPTLKKAVAAKRAAARPALKGESAKANPVSKPRVKKPAKSQALSIRKVVPA